MSCEVAREINEETAALCRKYPDKFGFVAALPFPSSEGSIEMMKPVDMEAGMKQLYYDLAGDPMPEAMDMLLKITDERHLLYGSDFPYVPAKVLLGKKAALDNELANRQ